MLFGRREENIIDGQGKKVFVMLWMSMLKGDDGDDDGRYKQDEKKGENEKREMLINCSNQSKWLNFNQLTMQLNVMGVSV